MIFSKKIILVLLFLLVPVLVLAQGLPQKGAKVLVVYYSRIGHTQLVAEKLANKFNADLERLIDTHKRTGLFGYVSASKDAVGKKTTVIEPLKHKPQDYDIIFIGGPSWVGNTTPAVRTFVTQNDLSGKKIGLFGLCHLNGVEHALEEVAELILKDKNRKFPTLPLREGQLKEEILTGKIDTFFQEIYEN
ncbi:MAG: hypothetical protein COV73_02040 [Candidatus Omnitrophica bacterium CG11_big_fil_rev_8_21_14_0_20_43_6]|nr:MAG: hypothetical protein COV73_02040 [Candidatus Omnitrophica bacterium CG11_big_fil_rev_8_21_14_0_20_43_6]